MWSLKDQTLIIGPSAVKEMSNGTMEALSLVGQSRDQFAMA